MEQWITFASRGRVGLIRPDGSDLHALAFDVPGQVNWQLGPLFADGERCIVTSYEEGKPWEHEVQTHLWVYHFGRGTLQEIATQGRLARMTLCAALLPGETRMIASPIIAHEQRIFNAALDGSDAWELTGAGEGFAYGIALSPDGQRIAHHITGPGELPYRIRTLNVDGTHKVEAAHQAGHLYFGPAWSPDGAWLAFEDCLFQADPGHDWADICLARPDGSAQRVVTQGQSQWFGTSFGAPQTRGGGSEMVQWSPDGQWLTYTRGTPGARTAWPFQPQRPDTDHFNRDYLPEQACGGTQVCLLNPFTQQVKELTPYEPLVWNFRARWAPDGGQLSFSRARVGQPSEVWAMDADGGQARLLTRGFDEMGADHARWLVLK
jgi:TolB protein